MRLFRRRTARCPTSCPHGSTGCSCLSIYCTHCPPLSSSIFGVIAQRGLTATWIVIILVLFSSLQVLSVPARDTARAAGQHSEFRLLARGWHRRRGELGKRAAGLCRASRARSGATVRCAQHYPRESGVPRRAHALRRPAAGDQQCGRRERVALADREYSETGRRARHTHARQLARHCRLSSVLAC